MAHTTNHYHILGLDAPSQASRKTLAVSEVRRAYKAALLAVHPDKQQATGDKATSARSTTIDQVKAAYAILSHEKSKAEYDEHFPVNDDEEDDKKAPTLPSLRAHDWRRTGGYKSKASTDFILGLDLLDLEDFQACERAVDEDDKDDKDDKDDRHSKDEVKMQWTRNCRCGAHPAFRIDEEELEEAEERGEREVLVGCQGCSLWLRVGFDVQVQVQVQ